MKANFKGCLHVVLEHEGGYADHPRDPGGRTMKGVTQAVYNDYRSRKGLDYDNVRHIEDDEVREIYRQMYWNVVKGDELPYGTDLALFDWAVNSGPHRATKGIQRTLRKLGHKQVKVDGIVGSRTLSAIERTEDQHELVSRLMDRRMSFLERLPIWSTFKRGWTRRVKDVRKNALKMVLGNPHDVPEPKPVPDAIKEKPQKPKSFIKWLVGLVGGSSAAGFGAIANVDNIYALVAVAIVITALIAFFAVEESEAPA